MKLIKLTLLNKQPVHININHIGHFFEVPEQRRGSELVERKYTSVGETTHNNGGFNVVESCEEIIDLIINSKEL